MADELHGYASVGVELLFERKNAKGFGKAAADQVHAPGAPGPELRANVIDDSSALGAQLAREAEMKARKICEDGERGFAATRFVDKMTHGADERG